MNLKIIEDIIRSEPRNRYETRFLLCEYFKRNGCNLFLASEKAEAATSTFVEEVQTVITEGHSNNVYCLFDKVTQKITVVNLDFFRVLKINEQLCNLTWQEFEDFCGVLIQNCFGAVNVQITQRSADMGLDFIGKIPFKSKYCTEAFAYIEIYGQAKKYANNVSRTDVDAFTAFANRKKRDGQYPAQLFLLCTTSDFIPSAQDEIRKNCFVGVNGKQIATLIFREIGTEAVDDDLVRYFLSRNRLR